MGKVIAVLAAFALLTVGCEGVPPIDEAAGPTPQRTPPQTEAVDDEADEAEAAEVVALDDEPTGDLGPEHRFDDGQHQWQEAGLTLEVLAIRISSREQVLQAADVGWALDDATNSIVAMKVRASNGMDQTVNWYINQAALQIGSEQRDASGFLSDDVGGMNMLAGTVDEGTVIWEFRTAAEELDAVGQARMVVSPVYNESIDQVAGGADLTFSWP